MWAYCGITPWHMAYSKVFSMHISMRSIDLLDYDSKPNASYELKRLTVFRHCQYWQYMTNLRRQHIFN